MMLVTFLTFIICNWITSDCLIHFDNDIQDDFQGKSVQQMPFLGPRLGTSENFVQIVDHFSPSDTRTWRQVSKTWLSDIKICV